MARNVFFSFHYQRDISRVQQVKNHYVTKENYTASGYFDGSLEEKSKKEGDAAVKKLIDNGLSGSSVLCVLIGNETYKRRWVDYEIQKSVELGMGVFGIRVHQLKNLNGLKDLSGSIPFNFLGYVTENGKLQPKIKYNDGWKNAPHLSPISSSCAPYLKGTTNPSLGNIFNVYDWIDNDGYNNFGKWVESAANQAGR